MTPCRLEFDARMMNEIKPMLPNGMSPDSTGATPAHSSNRATTRSLSTSQALIGTDERMQCGVSQYPYSSVGQITFTSSTGGYICSGTLIGPNQVLTAAHCLWDLDTKQFVTDVEFAPGRYRTADGSTVNPFGVYAFDHATVYQLYKDSNGGIGDMGVITLGSPAGNITGYLGVSRFCSIGSQVGISIAGYPSDKPFGSCYYSQCTASYDCRQVAGADSSACCAA
jgi:glutamyl endopeptidase